MQMTPEQARQRFDGARVARLGTVTDVGDPHLVPVTFAVIDGRAGGPPTERIVFAVDHKPKSTTALARLANIAAHPRVSFLVDHYDEDWDRLWWARAEALAAVIDGAPRAAAITALSEKYPQYATIPPSGVVVGAAVIRWSGWQAQG